MSHMSAICPVSVSAKDHAKDHFIHRNNMTYAGGHVIADLWGCSGLRSVRKARQTLRAAVKAANATLLYIKVFRTKRGALTVVAVLAESHMILHTRPDQKLLLMDAFMCGCADPREAYRVSRICYAPKRVDMGEHKRGIV
jgi:S-adenosylmethionine decarboxylase